MVLSRFPVDKEDEHGNTLLIVASQNCNQKMCEMLLRRKALVNHQNVNGNTALHFAMAYDQKVRVHTHFSYSTVFYSSIHKSRKGRVWLADGREVWWVCRARWASS